MGLLSQPTITSMTTRAWAGAADAGGATVIGVIGAAALVDLMLASVAQV